MNRIQGAEYNTRFGCYTELFSSLTLLKIPHLLLHRLERKDQMQVKKKRWNVTEL